MLHFRKLFPMLLCAALVTLSRPSNAALIRTYDLDSLCYMSTDVVEATLNWQQEPGQSIWQHTISATVVNSIAGQYRSGDVIPALDVDPYNPSVIGQRCIVFISRKRFTFYLQPSEAIAPHVTDLLLVDRRGHVRRYFQWSDPGELWAEGFMPPEDTENDSAEQKYPTLADERQIIASKWSTVDRLRPLLSHDPAPADVPVLLSLLQEREAHNQGGGLPFYQLFSRLQDAITEVICSRLADLCDPAIALNGLSLVKYSRTSGLETAPFRTDKSIEYARSVMTDSHEAVDRRIAAVDVLRHTGSQPEISEQEKGADQNAIRSLTLAQDTPDSLRLALFPFLNLEQAGVAEGLRQVYHQVDSEEVQFAIERAFYFEPGHPDHDGYFALHPASGPIISIVRVPPQLGIKSGFISLEAEYVHTKAMEGVPLTNDYVCTNIATGKTFRLYLSPYIYGKSSVEEGLPLPKSLVPGRYQIALEFRQNNRLISTGHSATMTLP